jgi:hypothetical protein
MDYYVTSAGSFLFYFALTFSFSRLGLRLIERFGSPWYAVIGIHLLSAFLSVVVYLTLAPLLLRLFPTHFLFFGITNGAVLNVQFILLIGDFVQLHTKKIYGPIVAAILALLAGYVQSRMHPYGVFKPGVIDSMLEPRLADALDSKGANREMIAVLKTDFPDEYRRLHDSYLASLKNAAGKEETLRAVYSMIDRRLLSDIGVFLKSHRSDLLRAPDADLIGIGRANLDLLEGAQADVPLCVAMVIGKSPSVEFSNEAAPDFVRQFLGGVSVAELTAIRDGMDHPVVRTLTEVPLTAVRAVVAKELAQPQLSLDPSEADREMNAEARTCQAGIDVYRTILKLPPHDAAIVIAYFTAHQAH